MESIRMRAMRAIGLDVEGEAMVCHQFLHFWDIDLQTGVGIVEGHDLYNKSIAGKILVLAGAKGGVASSMPIVELVKKGHGPKALLYRKTNPIMVQGAILAGIPIMDGFDRDPVETIKSGDWLKVSPAEHIVTIVRK